MATKRTTSGSPSARQSLADDSEFVNTLYYGKSGTGKTLAAAHMAKLGPVVFINAENGLKKRAVKQHGIDPANILIFPGDGETISFKEIEDLGWALKAELDDDPTRYAGIVWDSASETHKVLLTAQANKAWEKAQRAGRERDRFFIDRPDYGAMTEQMRTLVQFYRDLPCHMAITALERRDQDDDGKVQYAPAVTPALQADLIGWMDIIGHTYVETFKATGPEYRADFEPAGKYQAKDRFEALPKMLVDPFFDRIVGYVRDEITSDNDPVMNAARKRQAARIKAGAKKATDPEDDEDDD